MNFEAFHLVMTHCVESLILYYFSNKQILEGEIKDAKMSSFPSDFQTAIKNQFPLYSLYELLMSLRSSLDPMVCKITTRDIL